MPWGNQRTCAPYLEKPLHCNYRALTIQSPCSVRREASEPQVEKAACHNEDPIQPKVRKEKKLNSLQKCGMSFRVRLCTGEKNKLVKDTKCSLDLQRTILKAGLLWWLSDKESACKCKRRRFDCWVGKIPWKRKWQATPVFLLGKSHRQRSLKGCSPWGHKRVVHELANK